jgi:hypothetical protein
MATDRPRLARASSAFSKACESFRTRRRDLSSCSQASIRRRISSERGTVMVSMARVCHGRGGAKVQR